MNDDILSSSCVYTCVVNDYDSLRSLPVNFGIKSICFSNCSTSKESGWDFIKPICPPRLTNGHDINRYHKFFPHLVLSDYRYTIYIDGNIRYGGDYFELIDVLRKTNSAIAVFRHPQRSTIVEEVEACASLNKFDGFDSKIIKKQLEFYESECFPLDYPLSANYIIVRDNYNSKLRSAMSLWWSQLFEYSKRDQISLGYVLWKCEVPWVFLDDHSDTFIENIYRVPHRKSIFNRSCIKLKNTFLTLLKAVF